VLSLCFNTVILDHENYKAFSIIQSVIFSAPDKNTLEKCNQFLLMNDTIHVSKSCKPLSTRWLEIGSNSTLKNRTDVDQSQAQSDLRFLMKVLLRRSVELVSSHLKLFVCLTQSLSLDKHVTALSDK